jgi:chromosome segregation ATPase
MQQTAELSAANEILREQIFEQERVKGELEEHRDKLEQRLKQQSDKLKTVETQLQDEITKRKKEGEYSRQQYHTIKAVFERLRTRIDELRASGLVGESDVCKTVAPLETAVSLSTNEEILVHVFRENVALQKPELINAAVDKSIAKEFEH